MIEFRCTSPNADGPTAETHGYRRFPVIQEAMMVQAQEAEFETIAACLTGALPEEVDQRAALIALGLVTAGVVCGAEPGDRSELVEAFCKLLRESVAQELN